MTTGNGLDNTEIIDLSGNCDTFLSNFPKKFRGTTGQLLNDNVIICGGCSSNYSIFSSDCFILRKGATSFENFLSMKVARSNAKSVITQGHIWITGGYDHDGNTRLSSTEYIPKSSTNAPNLPEPVESHAIIDINETTTMLIGGYTNTNLESPNTYYFNHQSKTWKSGPCLITGRNQHTAGLIRDHVTHTQHIVVAGGLRTVATHDVAVDSVELLHNGESQWKEGIYFFESFLVCM